MKKLYFLILLIFISTSEIWSQLSITDNTTKVITFDATLAGVSNGSFLSAGFSPTPADGQLNSNAWAVTGWSDGALVFGGTRTTASTDYVRGSLTAATSTGGMFSYLQDENRMLLIQPGGSDWEPGTLTLRIQNNTGSTITSFEISYDLFVRNDQPRSNHFNFSYSDDNATYTPVASLNYASPAAADALGLQSVGTKSITITDLEIENEGYFYIRWEGSANSGTGSRDEFALDNISVKGIFSPAAPCTSANEATGASATAGNTTINTAWTKPSTCADNVLVVASASTANTWSPSGEPGDYTGDAVYGAGDPLGNGYLVYNGTGNSVNVTGLTNSTNYYFKIFTYSAVANAWSTGVEVNATPAPVTTASDYFRTKANGNWSNLSVWESSSDGLAWQASTLVPNQNANTISIFDTVVINANITVDQVVVENGGFIDNTSNVVTVNNGDGTDLIIKNGGKVKWGNTGTPVTSSNPQILVETGGVLEIARTGYTANGGGINASIYQYQSGAIVEYTPTSAFSASGVTIFPNVDANTIPIFRVVSSVANVGGGNAFVLNGILEVVDTNPDDENATTVSFANGGTKTFRNGIRGVGNAVVTQNAGSGQFIITSSNAVLGGDLTLNIATGSSLLVETGADVSLISNQSISAINLKGKVTLGNYNLTANQLSYSTGYVVTNGTGSLTLNNVSAATLPIGTATAFLPVSITNGGAFNYSANVTGSLSGLCVTADPAKSIPATWNLGSTNPDPSAVVFAFDFTEAVAGEEFVAEDAKVVHCGSEKEVKGSVSGTIATASGFTSFSPFLVTSDPIALPVTLTQFTGISNAKGVQLNWATAMEQNNSHYEIERKDNNGQFVMIAAVDSKNSASGAAYQFTDIVAPAGSISYRLRMVDVDGKFSYSPIVTIEKTYTAYKLGLFTNPVQSVLPVTISGPQGEGVLRIVSATGKVIRSEKLSINGSHVRNIDVSSLAAGVYIVQFSNSTTNQSLRFVKQ